MYIPRFMVRLALLGLLLVPVAGTRAAEACFPETGFCARGRFLDYWQQHGGLARNGYPLSDARQELLADGNTYTVQYFERVRMEYHPENPPPDDVLLGLFGQRVLRQRFDYDPIGYQATIASAPPVEGQTYFPETDHNLGGGFRDYWQANGGLAQFGYPITEEFEEYLPVVPPHHRVQYFERARLESHPENPSPDDIELGQFGRDILAEANFLTGRFGARYLTDPRVRELLGAPTSPPTLTAGATQAFERGRMVFEQGSGNGLIYVLCGDPQAGEVMAPPGYRYFVNTWDATQPVGGGPGSQPGFYEPQRGFSKLWRENAAVRDCLGDATSADETAFPLTWQAFTRGIILSTPAEGMADILWTEYGRDKRPVRDFYERIALPAL